MKNTPQAAVKLPQSKEDCAIAIAEYARLGETLDALESALSKRIATLNENAEEKAAPMRAQRQALFDAVESYSGVNRKALTEAGKRKFFDFTTGRVQWNLGRMRLNVDSTQSEGLIKGLMKRGYTACVKTTASIVASELKKLPDEVIESFDSLSYKRAPETFVIKPFAGKVDQAAEPKSDEATA